jgi:hypothetical protein
MKRIAHIFVDEYGTPSLNIEKQGTSSHFIYTAIVISANNIDLARTTHKRIIDTYFQGTHLKSKNINHTKRIKIIKELASFDHYVISLIVDKSKIESIGLSQKTIFIKFFNKLFVKSFFNKYEEFHVYCDKTGSSDFQISLKEFIGLNTYQLDMFDKNTFNIKDDISEEPLIQLADFYCGCMGHYYCSSHFKNQSIAIHNLIKARIFVEFFPKEYTSLFGAETFYKETFNQEIYSIAIDSGKECFNNSRDDVSRELLNILLLESKLTPFRVVSGKEIINKFKSCGVEIKNPINEIAKLRENGVLVVSPIGKKGYKFPCNEDEIAQFYDRFISNIIPQIKCIGILNKVLVEQSIGKINILSKDEYSTLNSLVDIISNHKFNEQLIK